MDKTIKFLKKHLFVITWLKMIITKKCKACKLVMQRYDKTLPIKKFLFAVTLEIEIITVFMEREKFEQGEN